MAENGTYPNYQGGIPMPNRRKYREFYLELQDLMKLHGVNSLEYLNCRIDAKGKLVYNKDHVLIPETSCTEHKYSEDAHKLLVQIAIEHALETKNEDLFHRAMREIFIARITGTILMKLNKACSRGVPM